MDFRQLRYALALAEHQHFGRAAAAVGIAQPPLSTSIARLEAEVGVRLFDRTRDGVVPTAAGEALLARARRIDTELTAAGNDARRAARGDTGSLSIGFVASALLSALPAVLRAYRIAHPRVRLQAEEMTTQRGSRALLAGEVDVVIGRGAPRGRGAERVRSVPISRDHLSGAVASHHPFAGQQRVGLAQLHGQSLVLVTSDAEPAITTALGELLTAFPEPSDITYASDTQTIIGLAACGFGIGLGPQDMRCAARDDTWIFDVRPRIALPSLTLSFRDDAPSPSLTAFLGVVADTCAPSRRELARLLRVG